MDPYRACTNSEREALALYRWNMTLSGALHESLGLVEVVLRNAIDRRLQLWNSSQPAAQGVSSYGTNWVETPARPLWAILNPPGRGGTRHSSYRTALNRANKDKDLRDPTHPRHGIEVTHDDVVAHLTFGTWNSLLPRQRDLRGQLQPASQKVLWDNALNLAFPHHPDALVIRYWVDRLHRLRNRVAHLEPLIATDVASYHRTAARLLRAIDPAVGDWYAGSSRVLPVLRQRP